MCGINGFNWDNKKKINLMNESIKHRGPDNQQTEIFPWASFGHLRLSIIDCSENGNQPLYDTTKNFCIVFNGEIYNYLELKEKYLKDISLHTKTDTEIILEMYKKYGETCVNYFNGMWSFAIINLKDETIFCSRDRLGIKPFHYYWNGDKFIFSSEIKAILEHDIKTEIRKEAITSYLKYRYVINDETFFKNIKKLVPGSNLTYNHKEKNITIKSYWDLKQTESLDDYKTEKKEIETIFNSAVKYRLISDVETSCITSGGLDSSYISAIAAIEKKNIRTYTVRFEEEGYDESSFAKILSQKYNTNHTVITINDKQYWDAMKTFQQFKDEPIGVPNEVALYLLFKEIKKNVKVTLAGEGADEIFGGYGRIFRSPFLFEKKFIENKELTFLDYFMDQYGYFKDKELKNILNNGTFKSFINEFKNVFEKCPRDNYNKISYVFIKKHLPGLLARGDSSSMANGVESRVPFLDHRLVEKAYTLPMIYKNTFRSQKSLIASIEKNDPSEISEIYDNPKIILKEIAKKQVPKEIINRKKIGFPLPLNKWINDENTIHKIKNRIKNSLETKKFFNLKNLEVWMNDDPETKGQKIWMINSLIEWLELTKNKYGDKLTS